MADFHAADLWVAVVPSTEKVGPAMEAAGKEAKTKFGSGVKGIGDTIHDDLGKAASKAKESFSNVGTSIKDVFSKAGKDSHESLTTSFTATGTTIKDIFTKAGKEGAGTLTESFSKAGSDAVSSLTSKFSAHAGPLQSTFDDLGKQLGGKLGGAIGDGLKKLDQPLKDVGIDIGAWQTPIQDAVTQFSTIKATTEEFAGIFKDLPGRIGMVGAAISELAGPISVAAAGLAAIWNGLPGIGGGMSQILAAPTNLDTSPAALGLPSTSLSVQTPAGSMALPGMPQPVDANSLPPGLPPGVQYQATQGSLDPFAALGGAPVNPSAPQALIPIAPGANQHPFITPPSAALPPLAPMDMPDGVAPPPITPRQGAAPPSVAPSGNGGVPLTQNPDGTWTSPNPAWKHLITRESGGNPGIYNRSDSNAAAGDPSQGLFQFTRSTWAAHGGLKYGRDPSKATPQQQAEIAANLIRANPSGSDWGAGMSGRESASGLLGGVGAPGAGPASSGAGWFSSSDSGSANGGGGSSGGGSGGSGSGGSGSGLSGGSGPAGTPSNPVFVSIAGASGPGGGGPGSGGGAGASGAGGDGGMGDMSNFLSAGMSDAGLGNVLSPFGSGKSPMEFGATKLLTGLMGMIPHPGAAATAGVGPGAGPAPAGVPGNTTIIHGDVNSGMNVTQHGVTGSGVSDWKEQFNADAGRNGPATVVNGSFGPSST